MPEAPTDSNIADLYCSFWLGEYCFAVPSTAISEVHAAVPVTPVPGAPAAVRGYVNLRGQLVLVLDPGTLLLPESPPELASELIVFRPEVGEAFALSAGKIGDIVPVPREQIHIPKARPDDVDFSSDAHRREGLIAGHATLAAHLVTLIDPAKLLAAALSESRT